MQTELDTFTQAYIECAFWSSSEISDISNGEDELSDETLAKIMADCAKFQAENDLTGYPLRNAGHDFWLTRNRHGCGFWEEEFGTPEQCAKLTAAAHVFGECDLYRGDDGKIYI